MKVPLPPTPRVAAYLLAAALAVALAHSVYQIPIQVSDSLDIITIAADAPSTAALFSATGNDGTLRPLR